MGLDKYHKEARKKMERQVKRKLTYFDVVHHKDGNPKNNNLSNLLLTTPEEHARIENPAKGKTHSTPSWNKLSKEKVYKIFKLSKKYRWGNKPNYSKIAKELNISDQTVRRYILYGK